MYENVCMMLLSVHAAANARTLEQGIMFLESNPSKGVD